MFVGAHQSRLPRELVLKVQSLGARAQYIEIEGNGRNALDFHIAYYIGRLAAEHPGATFHLITKDTGFDPLIKHLRTKKIACLRAASLGAVPGLKPASVPPVASKVKTGSIPTVAKKVTATLAKNITARPRTLKKLHAFLKPFLGTQVTESRSIELAEALNRNGVLTVQGDKVTYPES